jgi:hypothetical protein
LPGDVKQSNLATNGIIEKEKKENGAGKNWRNNDQKFCQICQYKMIKECQLK